MIVSDEVKTLKRVNLLMKIQNCSYNLSNTSLLLILLLLEDHQAANCILLEYGTL